MKKPLTQIAWLPPLRAFASACLGWLVFRPLTWLIPRRPGLVVFFGRDGGKFLDNCKHLFATLQQHPDLVGESSYLVRDAALRDRLRALGARAERVSSLMGMWLRLRAGTFVVDSIDWAQGVGFAASRGARLVQLWHGIPLKQVQMALFEQRLKHFPRTIGLLLRLQRAVIGRFASTAWLLSTSPLVTERAFAPSFRFERISHAGYPRNDVLFGIGSALAELGVDERAKQAIAAFRASGSERRVGVYAPTFRDAMEDPFAAGRIDPDALSRIACELDLLLLIKLHPWMHGKLVTGDLPGLVFVAPESDLYPILREVDFLITDYSSIYFDFLLLDRPVLFFPYDLDHYLASERPMYFDYAEMTPGPKAFTMTALAAALAELSAGDDPWKAERARVRALVFEHIDGRAGERLLAELFPLPHVPIP